MAHFLVGDGLHFRPPTAEEFDFIIDVRPGFVDTDGSETPATVGDASVNNIVTDYSDPYYDLTVVGARRVKLAVLDATGSLSGRRLSRVSNGSCRVTASHPLLSRMVTLDMTRIDGNEYQSFVEHVSGSLARSVVDGIRAMAAGKPSSTKPIYSTQNHAATIYARNPACWAAAIDLTCASPWNSLGGITRAGTAISPRHTLHAAHYPVNIGTNIRFVTLDNVVVNRTVTAVENVPVGIADTQVALLNADLPETITPAKFLPSDAYDYLPTIQQWSVPLLGLDASENAMLFDSYMGAWAYPSRIAAERSAEWSPLTELIVGGDSGNPVFMVINGEAVVVSHWSSNPLDIYAVGPAYHRLLTEIEAVMTSLGGGYSPQTFDLSVFTNYGD